MANPENSVTNTVNERTATDLEIMRLIARAEEIFDTAPDMTPEDLDDTYRKQHPGFKISERSVANEREGMRLDLPGRIAHITTSIGALKTTMPADKPFDESLADYASFYDQRLHAVYPDTTSRHSVTASRIFEIGDQPAEAKLELVQKMGNSAIRTLYVRYALHRTTTDGGTLVQAGSLVNGNYALKNHYETLYDADGFSARTSDEARSYAELQLPHDPAFPLDAPLDIVQLELILPRDSNT